MSQPHSLGQPIPPRIYARIIVEMPGDRFFTIGASEFLVLPHAGDEIYFYQQLDDGKRHELIKFRVVNIVHKAQNLLSLQGEVPYRVNVGGIWIRVEPIDLHDTRIFNEIYRPIYAKLRHEAKTPLEDPHPASILDIPNTLKLNPI